MSGTMMSCGQTVKTQGAYKTRAKRGFWAAAGQPERNG
jgi:hypothetical protein